VENNKKDFTRNDIITTTNYNYKRHLYLSWKDQYKKGKMKIFEHVVNDKTFDKPALTHLLNTLQ